MRSYLFLSFIAIIVVPGSASAVDIPSLPASIGSETALKLVGKPQSWSRENMYEHVNGEAELLKRYGAEDLVYAAYENEKGEYLTVDILDLKAPVNAFGLYRLYAGCDGQDYKVSGATVLPGDFAYYAMLDRYFLRIDLDVADENSHRKEAVNEFLTRFSKVIPKPGSLPREVELLERESGRPCEVGYHPEHIDYDLESGPGYSWTGPDGEIYYMSFFPSPDEAESQATVLMTRGAPTVLVWGNAVTWPKVRTEETSGYLKGVLRRVVRW